MLRLTVSDNTNVTLSLGTDEITLDVGQFTAAGGYPDYRGEYVVDPKFLVQSLETTNKVLHDDVTVNAIQVESVTNLSGGQTVYIGGSF